MAQKFVALWRSLIHEKKHEGHNNGSDDIGSDEDTFLCDICQETKDNAAAFCSTCKTEMCNSCKLNHRANSSTAQHKLRLYSIKPRQHKRTGKGSKDNTDNKKGSLKPGKPWLTNVKATSLTVQWTKPANMTENGNFQIRYHEVGRSGRWKIWSDDTKSTKLNLEGLKSETKYQIKVCVVEDGEEWPNSPASDVVVTKTSLAAILAPSANVVEDGDPTILAVPVKAVSEARNETFKIKKYEIGVQDMLGSKERTILLVGATGTGKTTVVDALINYAVGVNLEDRYRFTIVQLEENESKKMQNQSVSQTEWTTSYTIHHQDGGRLNYTLTIIDTPGFGDTRGLEYDKRVVDQIRHIFSQPGKKGILSIDAICFLNKAPDARLTVEHRYIYESIMSLFGKDVEENICSFITFADGKKPPVLHCLKEAGLPYKTFFPFNNSALFSSAEEERGGHSIIRLFWEMGMKSFKYFFTHLDEMTPKSLEMTKSVLQERLKLEDTIEYMQKQVNEGIGCIANLQKVIHVFEKHKSDAVNNIDFEYDVQEEVVKAVKVDEGTYVTNCVKCNKTCHDGCKIKDNRNKKGCLAMDKSGNCTVCKYKCIWSRHKNEQYKHTVKMVTVKKTYFEMKKKFEKAKDEMNAYEKQKKEMEEQLKVYVDDMESKIVLVKKCQDRLNEIALRPHIHSMVDYIDLLIEKETMSSSDGYIDRIKVLELCKEKADPDRMADKLLKGSEKVMK